jgi:hypothetical protein
MDLKTSTVKMTFSTDSNKTVISCMVQIIMGSALFFLSLTQLQGFKKLQSMKLTDVNHQIKSDDPFLSEK